MIDSNQFFVSEEDGFYPHTIGQSLRFNDNDLAYLSRTPSTEGNRRTWTWSGWVKRGNLGNYQVLFGAGASTSNRLCIRLDLDKLYVFEVASAGTIDNVGTNAVFRDASAWYHVVVVYDTTQATASNRIKIYVNGNIQTSLADTDYPSQNHNGYVNLNASHFVGMSAGSTQYLDGYLSEVNFIDGQALDADSFGEFKSGVWIPKEYTGSYGTNGFYLKFSGNIGDDSSGNGNNWTANNLASTDIVLDSPTNNFATFNPIVGFGYVWRNGNLEYVTGDSDDAHGLATFPVDGKHYYEFLRVSTYGSGPTRPYVGLISSDLNNSVLVALDGEIGVWEQINGSFTLHSLGTISTTNGDIISCSVDTVAKTLQVFKNGVSQYTFTYSITAEMFPLVSDGRGSGSNSDGVTFIANFGQDSSFAGNKTAQGNRDANGIGDFYYEPPTGYLALCTANLPEPVFSPAEDESPQDHFNTVTYVGQTGAENITGVGFQPDFVWIKNRGTTNPHNLTDAIRGAGINLMSHSTSAEVDESAYITGFISDGFSLGLDGGNTGVNGNSYVAWNWKANGTGVTNTDGSITSTVSANVDAGFSIVSYTGNGSTGTVGHGLDKAPDLIIAKNRDLARNWAVYHQSISTSRIQLNTTDGATTSTIWQNGSHTDSVFSLGQSSWNNGSGNGHIAYCFHSVDGFSKVGSYTGNGSSNGPFVYTGFKPAFVMFKVASGGTGDWEIHDNTRVTYNPSDKRLYANLTNTEGTGTPQVDYLSNGFKLRTNFNNVNKSGATIVYIAFAENPFKYTTAE